MKIVQKSNRTDYAFYQETVHSWYATKLEKSRWLLALSAIGLWYGWETLAAVPFLISIIAVFMVLEMQGQYLTSLIQTGGGSGYSIRVWDRIAWGSFCIGQIMLIVINYLG